MAFVILVSLMIHVRPAAADAIFREVLGSSPAGPSIGTPHGISVSSAGDTIYVADSSGNRVIRLIRVIESDLSSRYEIDEDFAGNAEIGSDNGTLFAPRGVALDLGGDLYVADTGNNRVLRTDRFGAVQSILAGAGTSNGQVMAPGGVAVDMRNRPYVADTGNDRLQRFNANGTFQSLIGAGGLLNGPQDLAVDAFGNMFAADTGGHRIARFRSNGASNGMLGQRGPGSADGQFDAPHGIAFSSLNHEAVVADTNNDRVQRFDFRGDFRGTFSRPAAAGLDSPHGVAIDGQGAVYVSFPNNNAIGIWDHVVTDVEMLQSLSNIMQTEHDFERNTIRNLKDGDTGSGPRGMAFGQLAYQATRTESGLKALSQTRQQLDSQRRLVFLFDAQKWIGQFADADGIAIERIDAFLDALELVTAETASGRGNVYPMNDPFYGRYKSDTPLQLPLPPQVTFSLDVSTAATNIIKSARIGGDVERPEVLGSSITIDVDGLNLSVSDFTFDFASFDINGVPTGINRGFIPAGGQLFAEFSPEFDRFVAHAEGRITNDLYPESRPMFVFEDIEGFVYLPFGREEAAVYGLNEPIITPGLPGGPPTTRLGEAIVATRVEFDEATRTLVFHENTDPSLDPDVSIVLSPTDVFAHGLGDGEPLVGAHVSIAALELIGTDPATGRFLFEDAAFEISGAGGTFAGGQLTDVGIDPVTYAFTALVEFEDIPGAVESPFIDQWRRGPVIDLLGPQGTLQLLALTDDFSISAMTNTDFIHLTAIPEPSTLTIALLVTGVVASLAVGRRWSGRG